MGVRKRYNKWWVDFSFNRTRHRKVSPENSKKGAEAYELVLKQRLARGEPIDKITTKPITYRDFAVNWLETYVKSNNKFSEVQNKETILRIHLVPFFGKLSLERIKSFDIEQYKTEKLKESLSPKSINNHLTVLRKSLQCALEWELIQHFPYVRKLKVPPQIFDFLRIDESHRLINSADGIWRKMIITALGTGLRFGELIALNWDDIDLQRRELTVRKSLVRGILGSPKSNKIRKLPIPESVYTVLKDMSPKQGYIFSDTSGIPLNKHTCLRRLHECCQKACLREIGWHCLRHTFASHLAQAGANLVAVQNLLGHSEIRTTMRYAHITGDLLKEAIGVLEFERNKKTCHNNVTGH
jgi:integrase